MVKRRLCWRIHFHGDSLRWASSAFVSSEPLCRTGLWSDWARRTMYLHSISSCQDSVSIAGQGSQIKTSLFFTAGSSCLSPTPNTAASTFCLGYNAHAHTKYMQSKHCTASSPDACKMTSVDRHTHAHLNLIFIEQRVRASLGFYFAGITWTTGSLHETCECVCLNVIRVHFVALKVFISCCMSSR